MKNNSKLLKLEDIIPMSNCTHELLIKNCEELFSSIKQKMENLKSQYQKLPANCISALEKAFSAVCDVRRIPRDSKAIYDRNKTLFLQKYLSTLISLKRRIQLIEDTYLEKDSFITKMEQKQDCKEFNLVALVEESLLEAFHNIVLGNQKAILRKFLDNEIVNHAEMQMDFINRVLTEKESVIKWCRETFSASVVGIDTSSFIDASFVCSEYKYSVLVNYLTELIKNALTFSVIDTGLVSIKLETSSNSLTFTTYNFFIPKLLYKFNGFQTNLMCINTQIDSLSKICGITLENKVFSECQSESLYRTVFKFHF